MLNRLPLVVPLLFNSGNAFVAAIEAIGTPAIWIRASETGGTTLADSSGNGRTLSIAGTPTFGIAGLGSNTGIAIESDGATVNFTRASGGELTRKNGLSMCLVQFGSAGEGNFGAVEFYNTGVNNSGLWFNAGSMTLQYRHETGVGGSGFYRSISTTVLSTDTTYFLFWGVSDSDSKPHIYYATIGGTVTEMAYSLQQTASGTDTAYTALGVYSNSGTSQACDGIMDEYTHWNGVDIETADLQSIVDAVGAP